MSTTKSTSNKATEEKQQTPYWKRPLLRPPVGSQVRLLSDPADHVAVVFMVTLTENFLRYADGTIINLDKDAPFTYVGFSDPANWYGFTRIVRLGNIEELTRVSTSIKKGKQLRPIILHNDKLVDGRLRLHACNLAGVKPIYADVNTLGRRNNISPFTSDISELELLDIWYALNLVRKGSFTSQMGEAGIQIEEIKREYKRILKAAATNNLKELAS